MEKIKITVEQESFLKTFKKVGGTFEGFVSKGVNDFYKAIADFSPVEFSLLLHGWYEVEQPVEFEVGDWIEDDGQYGQITYIDKDTCSVKGDLFSIYISYARKHFEKVTEPWKIILLELGRGKPEFNKNDIIVTEIEVYEAEYLSDEEIIVLFERDLVRAFHPAEHRIEVKGNES